MRVSDVEKLTGLPAKTIKYYEEQQLITPERNTANRYREYSDNEIKVLKKIKLLRKLGFTIDNIKTMLDNPEQLKDVFYDHIKDIDTNVKNLEKAKEICKNILFDNDNVDFVDFAKYLEQVSNMEEEGYKFMDENVRERKFKKDSKLTVYFLIAFVLLICLLIFFSSRGWIAPGLGLVLIVGMLLFLVVRHSRTTGYICKACGKRFIISVIKDFVSPHNIGTKYLKCPHCGKRTWAKESYRD